MFMVVITGARGVDVNYLMSMRFANEWVFSYYNTEQAIW